MKLVLTNCDPKNKFSPERELLIKVQIDNSFELGWKAKDIILATNFDYKYRGVKSILVGDDNYCGIDDSRYCFIVSSHILIMSTLFKMGVFEDELYWYHDFDAYQQFPITEEELDIEGIDFATTDYGWSKKWNLGCIFFRKSAEDIFHLLKETIYKDKVADERSFRMLIETGDITPNRYKKLNITYNFGTRHMDKSYPMAEKPLKIVHFHPYRFNEKDGEIIRKPYKDIVTFDNTLNMFMYGKNPMGEILMTDRLIELFKRHDIK